MILVNRDLHLYPWAFPGGSGTFRTPPGYIWESLEVFSDRVNGWRLTVFLAGAGEEAAAFFVGLEQVDWAKENVLGVVFVQPGPVLPLAFLERGKRGICIHSELLGSQTFYNFLGAVAVVNIKIYNGYFSKEVKNKRYLIEFL